MFAKKPGLDALGLGDSMVDLATMAATIPTLGGNVWATEARMYPGGTVANVAANLSRLDIRSGFAGCVGFDLYGEYILSEFEAAGVDTGDVIRTEEVYTGIVITILDNSGERTFIACAQGAAYAKITPADVDAIQFKRAKVLHTSGVCLVEEPSRSAMLAGMQTAQAQAMRVYFDPNLRLQGNVFPEDLHKAQWQALRFTDVVLLSVQELFLLTGYEDIETGEAMIRAQGPELVVLKKGADGVEAYSQKEFWEVPAFRVSVVDTTGAGDSFDAGFIAAQLRGQEVEDALRYASAVAALNVIHAGARTVPTHSEVLAFLEKQS